MMELELGSVNPTLLRDAFGDRVKIDEPLARYTAARLGGSAEVFLEVGSSQELIQVASLSWRYNLPFVILGGGSNVLVSDNGVNGLVVLNRSRLVRFDENANPPTVWAESGVNFGMLARQAAQRGLSGLEWAAGIPGTIGGAVVGNAGAHGSDIASNLRLAAILHRNHDRPDQAPRFDEWEVDVFDFSYRSSVLKQRPGDAIVISALLELEHSTPETVQSRVEEYVNYRRQTQPPGASMGSMFKNPPDDFAGRLIDMAGLKGERIGDAQISPVHANFFLNLGAASAQDVYDLVRLARQTVADKFGVNLELEIVLLGEW